MPADRLLRLGALVMGVGLVCTLIALIPLFAPSVQMSSAWWFLSMLTGVGLAMVIAGLLTGSRSRKGRHHAS